MKGTEYLGVLGVLKWTMMGLILTKYSPRVFCQRLIAASIVYLYP